MEKVCFVFIPLEGNMNINTNKTPRKRGAVYMHVVFNELQIS